MQTLKVAFATVLAGLMIALVLPVFMFIVCGVLCITHVMQVDTGAALVDWSYNVSMFSLIK